MPGDGDDAWSLTDLEWAALQEELAPRPVLPAPSVDCYVCHSTSTSAVFCSVTVCEAHEPMLCQVYVTKLTQTNDQRHYWPEVRRPEHRLPGFCRVDPSKYGVI